MVKWISALAKTRRNISKGLGRVLNRKEPLDTLTLEEMEETLIRADIPANLAMEWVEEIEDAYRGLKISPREMLKKLLLRQFGIQDKPDWKQGPRPFTFLLVGVNGSGKTTTCAKLAYKARQDGLTPLLGATDTFRAAGSEQLNLWADMVGCEAVIGKQGADAAAVAYDSLDAAMARSADIVIVDTAGRMHTKAPLMQELEKVRRAMAKRVDGAPHESWIVLDATLGHNAVAQARVFNEATPLTGAVVSKLDGSSKAGFVFSIEKELGVPVRMVGLGEDKQDLAWFDPGSFVDALVGNEEEGRV